MRPCGQRNAPKKRSELVEIIELKDHPWFCGAQFHPEFTGAPVKTAAVVPGLCEGGVGAEAGEVVAPNWISARALYERG